MAADLPLAQMQRLLDGLSQKDPKVTLADADFWHFAQTYSQDPIAQRLVWTGLQHMFAREALEGFLERVMRTGRADPADRAGIASSLSQLYGSQHMFNQLWSQFLGMNPQTASDPVIQRITADVHSINTWQQNLNPTAVEVYVAATGAAQ